jgi:hypothetical protein
MTAFTQTPRSEYPTATQQERTRWLRPSPLIARAGRQACLSTAIQKACDRERIGTGAAPRLQRTYIGKLEAEGVIQRMRMD